MYLLSWTKRSFCKEPNARCSFPTSNSFCPASGKSLLLVVFFYCTNSTCTGLLFVRLLCARPPVTPACFLHMLPFSRWCLAGRQVLVEGQVLSCSHGCCPQSRVQPAGLRQPGLTGARWSGLHCHVAQLHQNPGETLAESQEDCSGLNQLSGVFLVLMLWP